MPPTAIVIDALDPAVTADVDLPAGGFGGVVTGPSGPLWQASLSFRNVDTGFTQTAQVDPNGNFGIGYIPTGSYEITVAYDWGRTYSFGVFETGDTGLSVSLAVPAQLSGTVTTSAGDPIEGATVSLVTVFGLWSFSTVAVDADGRYQFPFETSGNFYLSVQTPGNDAKYWYGSGYDDPITTPGSILTLTFGEQDVVPFVIPTGGFSGSIIGDAPTSNATATFELVDGSFSRTVAIAGNGSVSIGSIPEGAYTITVSYDVGSGFIRTYSFPGTYTTGPNGLAISLQYPVPPVAAATMRGVVRNPDLSPADGARVRVLAAGDIEVAETLSEPDGTYVVTVAPGTYRVLATKGTSAVDEPSVFLDEGATLVKDFTMASAFGLGVVQGTVVDADGVAFESGSVFVQCADGTSRSVTLTNGELNTEIPTATTCVARFTNFSTLDHFGTSYSASIAHPIIPLTAGTNQTWQIPTATITLNVVDGDGTDIEVQQVTNNTYTFIPPPPGTPPGFINDASANTSIGQPMGMPGGPTLTGAP